MSACRSCGAEITWVVTRMGRRMPLDLMPVEHGNVVVTDEFDRRTGSRIAEVLGPPTLNGEVDAGVQRFVSHFSTCPNADQHRRRG